MHSDAVAEGGWVGLWVSFFKRRRWNLRRYAKSTLAILGCLKFCEHLEQNLIYTRPRGIGGGSGRKQQERPRERLRKVLRKALRMSARKRLRKVLKKVLKRCLRGRARLFLRAETNYDAVRLKKKCL